MFARVGAGYLQFKETDTGTEVDFDPDGPASGHPWPTRLTILDNVRPEQIRQNGVLWR